MAEDQKSKRATTTIILIVVLLAIAALVVLVAKCPIPVPADETLPSVELQKKQEAPPMDVGKAPLDISKPDLGLPQP